MSDVEFAEEMKGWISFGDTDFRPGAEKGERDGDYLLHFAEEAVR